MSDTKGPCIYITLCGSFILYMHLLIYVLNPWKKSHYEVVVILWECLYLVGHRFTWIFLFKPFRCLITWPVFYQNDLLCRNWRDVSAVFLESLDLIPSTCTVASHGSTAPVTRNLMPSSSFHGHCMQILHRFPCWHDTHTHKINKFSKLKTHNSSVKRIMLVFKCCQECGFQALVLVLVLMLNLLYTEPFLAWFKFRTRVVQLM